MPPLQDAVHLLLSVMHFEFYDASVDFMVFLSDPKPGLNCTFRLYYILIDSTLPFSDHVLCTRLYVCVLHVLPVLTRYCTLGFATARSTSSHVRSCTLCSIVPLCTLCFTKKAAVPL
jgi:hypothetical protein